MFAVQLNKIAAQAARAENKSSEIESEQSKIKKELDKAREHEKAFEDEYGGVSRRLEALGQSTLSLHKDCRTMEAQLKKDLGDSQRILHQRQVSPIEGTKIIRSTISETEAAKPVFQSRVVIQGTSVHKKVPREGQINAKTAEEKPAAAGLRTATLRGTGRTLMTSRGRVQQKSHELVKEDRRIRKDAKLPLKGSETKRDWPCSRHSA
jgi:hypothetical protein